MIIDVSHHNGSINWAQVAKQVSGVFIKATEGASYVDPMFIKNARLAQSQGLEIGYYHYATLRKLNGIITDAKKEAAWFLNNVKKAPTQSLPLVLDLEDPKIDLSRYEFLTYVQTFFMQLHLNGYHEYMLYSGTSYLNEHLPLNHPLGHIRLWIADYKEPHSVPRGFDKIELLQYTDRGKIDGIMTSVDLNKYITA